MDLFSVEILDRTVELAVDAMPPDQNPRVAACVIAIREYIESPNPLYERALQRAVLELLEIARLNCQFLIAARLAPIARRLSEPGGQSGVA
ncbi:MAG TPA: hypothetical protein VGK48_23950 [Terriglobia bacterium]|jgi:hypothetical protein